MFTYVCFSPPEHALGSHKIVRRTRPVLPAYQIARLVPRSVRQGMSTLLDRGDRYSTPSKSSICYGGLFRAFAWAIILPFDHSLLPSRPLGREKFEMHDASQIIEASSPSYRAQLRSARCDDVSNGRALKHVGNFTHSSQGDAVRRVELGFALEHRWQDPYMHSLLRCKD